MDKALMKRGHTASAENIGLASHFHRSRVQVAMDLLNKNPEHPDLFTVLTNYANLLRKTSRDNKAAKLEARASKIQTRANSK
jgi:hypothetical protein